jgi:hypothetical protein
MNLDCPTNSRPVRCRPHSPRPRRSPLEHYADPRSHAATTGEGCSCRFRCISDLPRRPRCTCHPSRRRVSVARRHARRLLGRLGHGGHGSRWSVVRNHGGLSASVRARRHASAAVRMATVELKKRRWVLQALRRARATNLLISRSHSTELAIAAQNTQSWALKLTVPNAR